MIESATARDLPEIRALLERMHLPLAGVDEHLPAVLVARDGGQIVGTAALELYADGALLRSVAVESSRQGQVASSARPGRIWLPRRSSPRRCSAIGASSAA